MHVSCIKHAGVVPLVLEPTPANAMHILRSSLAEKLVGRTLATQLSRRILALVSDEAVPLLPDGDVRLGVSQDLVSTLDELQCGPRDHEDESLICCQPAKRLRRDPEGHLSRAAAVTKQVIFAIENRVPFMRVEGTVAAASALIAAISGSSGESSPASRSTEESVEDLLGSRFTLARHMLLLDGAVDRYTLERIFRLREQADFAGVALATDESPPSQPRFRGLRFQITIMYLGAFAPRSQWDDLATPPLTCTGLLGDIAHCPNKKGTEVSRVLEKQLARVGLNVYDVVSGTGDGAGENEGISGIHSLFESLSPGYVRRRCLPHIAWRTCDMAIRSSGLDYKTLAAHFVDGITWSKLRVLATTKSQGASTSSRMGQQSASASSAQALPRS